MKLDDPIDALNERLASFRRREARLMAQEVSDTDRGINFSITLTHLLWRVVDGRAIPTNTEMRRVASAHARWVKAGLRLSRRAGQ
jgi:hypothetical protein